MSNSPSIPSFEQRVATLIHTRALRDSLIVTWQEIEDTIGDPTFQYYNSSVKIHTTTDTITWMKENTQVIERPPNSPNINPIKSCSKRLKKNLHQSLPNIHMPKGGSDVIRRHTVEISNYVWAKNTDNHLSQKAMGVNAWGDSCKGMVYQILVLGLLFLSIRMVYSQDLI